MQKEENKKFYEVPLYIEKLVNKLFKLREKENEMLEQIKDYIKLVGYPEDVPLSRLKHEEEDVIPGQTRLEMFD